MFASPHDVMPQRPPKLEDQLTLFSENNHESKSVVVEQVGDEIVNESEVRFENSKLKNLKLKNSKLNNSSS